MNTQNFKSRARLSAGVAFAVLSIATTSTPAFAQAAEEVTDEKAIVVTGSRIARPNLESASPVTVVGTEEIKDSGYTKIEDLTNALPQVFAGQSSGVSNGADGTATIDLRGLGPSRTLVLVDGRRLMPGNIGGGAGADLNFIPSALVSSVELLTGGASATYGADAVAGVVNFKMNRGFQGVRLDAQYGFYQHNNGNDIASTVNLSRNVAPQGSTINGGGFDVSLALGAGFDDDRGNVVAYAGYRTESPVTQDKYDYSVCTLNPSGTTASRLACGGSGTPARSRFGGFFNPTAARTQARGPAPAGSPAGTLGPLLFAADLITPILAPAATLTATQTLTDAGTLIPYVAARDSYNFGPLNYYRRNSKRFIAGAFADYEISDAIKPYLDVMFMDYSTDAQIAPSGAFFGTRTVNCNNPFLLANAALAASACVAPGTTLGALPTSTVGTPATTQILIGKRNVEGGPRFNDIGFTQFRIVTGVKGDISDAWSYDVSGQFGQITAANVYRNDVSSARIDEALLATGTLANPVCTSGNAACVPYNVFQPGGVTPAAAAYIGIPLVLTGTTKETIVGGNITGDLGKMGLKSPFSDEGLKVLFGAEYRKESLETQPDLSYINGDGAGQGGPTLPIAGSYSVRDLYSELVVPFVTEKPFFHDLSLELAFRNSKYTVPGGKGNSENTWKIAGNWSPIPDLKLRASRNRAVRSPNIGELFSNQSIGLFAGSDPCVNTGTAQVPTATAAQCARTGVTAAQYGNLVENTAEQYNQFGGGNLNLNPEKADSWSVGAVFAPKSFLNGLTLSVDYFNIKVKEAVGTIGAQVILDQCIENGDPFFCSKIVRAPASAGPAAGSLWLDESGFVNNQTTNTGSFGTSGFDINGDYRMNLGDNKLRWQFVGTVLDGYKFQPITNGFTYDCAGLYGLTCGSSNPKLRFNTNVKFTTANDFGFTVRWRHLSKVTLDGLSPQEGLGGTSPSSPTPNDDRIKAYNYFDVLFSLPIKDKATLRLGVNNVFDKDPPIVSQGSLAGTVGNGNTFPGTYDALGRYVFVNLSADF